ncbi:hypothetical protein P0R31_36960 [Bradyrhizobium yuanmingense]|uniref:hypothetical protein n=1 Tax=Bradyrhizobium yuanmingense TaxID=108015 RepID=UPI0023B8891C|nr:hypothetical protein [Bradyrhizobium yuanmingense]MDF0522829.1 hypothetical protein [Bradyrhizobium yuanmingense]
MLSRRHVLGLLAGSTVGMSGRSFAQTRELELTLADAGSDPIGLSKGDISGTGPFRIGMRLNEAREVIVKEYGAEPSETPERTPPVENVRSGPFVRSLSFRHQSSDGAKEKTTLDFTSPVSGARLYAIEREISYGGRLDFNEARQSLLRRYAPNGQPTQLSEAPPYSFTLVQVFSAGRAVNHRMAENAPHLRGCMWPGFHNVSAYDPESVRQAKAQWGCGGAIRAQLGAGNLKLLIVDMELMYADRVAAYEFMQREVRALPRGRTGIN